MNSFGNYEHKNNTDKKVNDIHLTLPKEATVISVDGVAPDAPDAQYNVEGSGSKDITITDQPVIKGGDCIIRLGFGGSELPPVKWQWTLDGSPIGGVEDVPKRARPAKKTSSKM